MVIAVMLFIPILPAYAAGTYDSSMSVSDNLVGANYYSLGICKYTGSSIDNVIELTDENRGDFTDAEALIGSVGVSYSTVTVGSTVHYIINQDDLDLAPGDRLYVCLWTDSPDALSSYTLDLVSTCTPGAGYSDVSFSVETVGTAGNSFAPGYATRIHLTADITYDSTAAPASLNAALQLKADGEGVGNVLFSDKVIRINTNNTALDNLIDTNQGDTVGSGDSACNLTDGGTVEGHESVAIENKQNGQGGIAPSGSANPQIDVSFGIKQGMKFVILITYTAAKNQSIDLHVTGTGLQLDYVGLPLNDNGNGVHTIVCYQNGGAAAHSKDPAQMPPQANWISSSGQITMNIHAHSNNHLDPNTRVELVFWESNPSGN